MHKALRRAAVAALAAGAAIAAQFAVIAPAQAAAPVITINATSKLKPVTNDVFVVYHVAKGVNSAAIHGKITGAAAGDVATLYTQQFPYKKAPTPLASRKLTAGTQVYSFTVTPTLATRYTVRLFPSTSHTLLAISKVQNLYVANEQLVPTGPQKCGRPVCHETFAVYTFVPPSTFSAEFSKHVYPYFAVNLGGATIPPTPKWLFLNAGHAKVTAPHRITGGEFKYTITYAFTIGSHSFNWVWTFCTRDTESKDGLGLPGTHSCGASKVPLTIPYLG